MSVQDAVVAAIEVVLGWELSDDAVSAAISAQARLMARVNSEEGSAAIQD